MKPGIKKLFMLPAIVASFGLLLTGRVTAQTPPSILVGTFGEIENVTAVATPPNGSWSGTGNIQSTPIVLYSYGGSGPIISYYGGPTNSDAGEYSGNYVNTGTYRTEGGLLENVSLQLNLTNETANLSFSYSINWTNGPGWSGSYGLTIGPLACVVSTNFGFFTVNLSSETNYPEGDIFGGSITSFTTSGQVAGTNTVLGIDVSQYQGAVYWPSVKTAGTTFAYVRSTKGASSDYGGQGSYVDTYFLKNMQGAIQNQILVGVYHYAVPTNNAPISEALTFLSESENYIGDGYLPPMLDLETDMANGYVAQKGGGSVGTAALATWVSSWLQTVATYTGVTPGIYTSTSVLSSYLDNNLSNINQYPLWIATYSGSPTSTPTSGDTEFSNWVFQQWSKTGVCPGISGSVDFDSFNGNYASIFQFTSHPGALTSLRMLTAPGGGAIQPPQNGQFQLGIFAPGQQQAVVQSSQDLINWANAKTLPLNNGTATFMDTAAGAKNQSFYRVQP